MKFQEFTQIMSNQGFEKLADIARELGVSPQAINNWKIRDQVPHKIAILIQEKYAELNSNINFIPQSQSTGEPNPNPYPSPYGYFEEDTISLWEIIAILKK